MKRIIAVSFAVLGLTGIARAQTQGDITISKVWSRATPSATAPGVVYFTVTDTGEPDQLTGASTPIAVKAQLHESKMENGIMKMRPINELPVTKGTPIALAPGGYHLMLTGLKQQLKAGDTFPLTLTFAHAGSLSTTVTVNKADAANGAKPSTEMKGMDMKGPDMGGAQ